MKLTNRLMKITTLVSKGSKIADIGTDHGYIPIYLLLNNTIESAILADINKGPLENAREEVIKNKLESKVDLRFGNGIRVLKDGEVDEIIIAGMGGVLISEIINADLCICKGVKKLILQPMQASSDLRKYLMKNKFQIIDEHLVSEDFRIYEILEVKYNENISNFDMEEIYFDVPEQLLKKEDTLVDKFIEKKIFECKSILNKLGDSNNDSIRDRREFVMSKLRKLESILEKRRSI